MNDLNIFRSLELNNNWNLIKIKDNGNFKKNMFKEL
jgi:hypothetical protein